MSDETVVARCSERKHVIENGHPSCDCKALILWPTAARNAACRDAAAGCCPRQGSRVSFADGVHRPRPDVTSFCKPCLGPRNLKPLPAQEAISPRGVVHYGTTDGRTICGKNATGAAWWWPC